MTAVKPGLAKLNITPKANSLNTMKASLSTATRTQGASYGIMAQRSIFSTGALTNPKMAYSPGISATRMMLLNASRLRYQTPVMQPCLHQNSGDDMMNKFMMGMMAMNMVAEMTKSVTAGIKDIKAARADSVKNKPKTEKTEVLKNTDANPTTSKSGITSAKANYETAKNNLTEFAQGYQKSVLGNSQEEIGKIFSADNIQNNDDKTKISQILSQLPKVDTINIPDITQFVSEENFVGAENAMTKASANINAYGDNVLTAIKTSIPQYIGTLRASLVTETDSQKRSEIQKRIDTLTHYQSNLEEQFSEQIGKMTRAVSDQKNKLASAKQKRDEALDSLCNNVEKSDEKIGKNKAEMTKLLVKLKDKNVSDDKKQEIAKEYNELAQECLDLQRDISNSGIADNPKNSKGKTVTIKFANKGSIMFVDSNGRNIDTTNNES